MLSEKLQRATSMMNSRHWCWQRRQTFWSRRTKCTYVKICPGFPSLFCPDGVTFREIFISPPQLQIQNWDGFCFFLPDRTKWNCMSQRAVWSKCCLKSTCCMKSNCSLPFHRISLCPFFLSLMYCFILCYLPANVLFPPSPPQPLWQIFLSHFILLKNVSVYIPELCLLGICFLFHLGVSSPLVFLYIYIDISDCLVHYPPPTIPFSFLTLFSCPDFRQDFSKSSGWIPGELTKDFHPPWKKPFHEATFVFPRGRMLTLHHPGCFMIPVEALRLLTFGMPDPNFRYTFIWGKSQLCTLQNNFRAGRTSTVKGHDAEGWDHVHLWRIHTAQHCGNVGQAETNNGEYRGRMHIFPG